MSDQLDVRKLLQTLGLIDYRRWQVLIALIVIVMIALAARMHGLFHDLPFSYYGDELHFIRRSIAMGTGDLNPHWFNKPAMLMYILLFCYGVMFIIGYLGGRFDSPDAFGAYFLEDMGPFILTGRVVVMVFAVIGVSVLFETARRLHGSIIAAWMTALAAAILPPLVLSSQTVKADAVAGVFVLISVGFYLRTYHAPSLVWPALAAIFAGFAMGTKYYGIILVPIYGLAEIARLWLHREPPLRVVIRLALITLLFLGVFFAVSPFSFFDPTLQNFIIYRVKAFLDPTYVHYDPDAAKSFQYGFVTMPAAAANVLATLARSASIGLPLMLLCLLGFAWMLSQPAYRWHACILLGPCLIFLFLCVTIWAFHASPRHFNSIYGLLLLALYPGALLFVRVLPFVPAQSRNAAAILLIAVCLIPSILQTLKANAAMNRIDSRSLAGQWIDTTINRDERVLLDDYGPELLPTVEAIERRLNTLHALPVHDAFTIHQAKRLALLKRYPPEFAHDFDELGHPWWSPVELTNDEMRGAREHRTMGNPLSDYEPQTVDEYRRLGYGYIITNSEARALYASAEGSANHPSYMAFYRELSGMEPIKVFDPTDWGGKGPTVEIYRLK